MEQRGRNEERALCALNAIPLFNSYFLGFESDVEKRNGMKGQEKVGI